MTQTDLTSPRTLVGRTSLRGHGATVLLLADDLPPGEHLGGRLVDVEPTASSGGKGPSHALRVASICAEGAEASELPGGAQGIAPGASVLHASHAGLTVEQIGTRIEALAARHGQPHVLGLAWSAPEDHHLAHAGRALAARWADGEPHAVATVAAAGHDGPGRLRFPASCEQILAVGACDAEGRPMPYCGTSPEQRKPEVMVPAASYSARAEDGSLHGLSGTSGAVAVVCGFAALWCERLLSLGREPTPPLVRAALLVGTKPTPHGPSRELDPAALDDAEPMVAVTRAPVLDAPLFVPLVARGGPVRIAVCVRAPPRPLGWVPTKPWLSASVRQSGRVLATEQAPRWVVLDLAADPRAELELELAIDGSVEDVAIVALGAEAREEPRSGRRRARDPIVVGISASHDASACVMRGGRLEVAIPLERLSRVKHDGVGFLSTDRAARYCLDSLGLRAKDVDLFAFNAQPLLPGWTGLSQPVADADLDLLDPFDERTIYVSHHLAHAYAAFWASGLDEATVLVCDGSGGSVVGADDLLIRGPQLAEYLRTSASERPALHVTSAYRFTRDGAELVLRERAPSFNVRCGSSSLGETYAAVSAYVFGSWQASGKLMGLAPYGSPQEHGPSLLVEGDDGWLGFSSEWKLHERAAVGRRPPMEHRHLAARIQADFERAVVQRARRAIERSGLPKLVFTGGLALNCRANDRIARELGKDRTFFYPASHDGGIAVGAAVAATALHTGAAPVGTRGHDFWGHPYSDADIELALRARASVLVTEPVTLERVAERIVGGEAIGWFEGAAELGPRALGHRSILADPRDRKTWDRINADIKYREDFRPFAPMTPVEDAHRYFELDEPSPYMLRVVGVRPEHRRALAAVCHVDGTARVQTVAREDAPRLHALLRHVERLIGLPVLLNTSLNRRGEPLVETPLQALDLMVASGLDAVVLGDVLAMPRLAEEIDEAHVLALPAGVEAIVRSTPMGPRAQVDVPHRGEFGMPLDVVVLLQHLDGARSVGAVLDEVRPRMSRAECTAWLTMLHRKNMLLLVDRVPPR